MGEIFDAYNDNEEKNKNWIIKKSFLFIFFLLSYYTFVFVMNFFKGIEKKSKPNKWECNFMSICEGFIVDIDSNE